MSEYLIYNGINTADFGIFISGAESFSAPEADVTFLTVPGRSGDLSINNGRFKNMTIRYPAFIRDGFKEKARAFVNQMLKERGYHVLTSSYDCSHFRQAEFWQAQEFDTGPWNRSASFTLLFTCKPQRFLVAGETAQTLSADGVVENPTEYPAKPLMRVYGAGTVTVNGIAVTTTASVTDIDSDMQDCYYGTTNLNNTVVLTDFPVLSPGENAVVLGSGITSVEITPRWWEV